MFFIKFLLNVLVYLLQIDTGNQISIKAVSRPFKKITKKRR
jgi:hypothetical protein